MLGSASVLERCRLRSDVVPVSRGPSVVGEKEWVRHGSAGCDRLVPTWAVTRCLPSGGLVLKAA